MSNIQYENKDSKPGDGPNVAGLTKPSAIQRDIDNYETLLKLWDECVQTQLEPDVRGRVIECQDQMKLFGFFFGINLTDHTDNFSNSLQNANMSAASGQRNANLTNETHEKIRKKSLKLCNSI